SSSALSQAIFVLYHDTTTTESNAWTALYPCTRPRGEVGMTHIVSQTKKVAACSKYEKEAFYQLLCQEFLGVTWNDFMRDFQEKDAVMILREEHNEGEIIGWSTLMVLTLALSGQEVKGIFSGDTVVLPEYRSGTGLGVELS